MNLSTSLFLVVSTLLLCCASAQTTTTATTAGTAAPGNDSCVNGPWSDLKKAWNAANNQILIHGEYLSIFNKTSKNQGFLQTIGLCVPNNEAYPFPSASSPEIARIIQSGKLRLAQPENFNGTTEPEEFPYTQRILFYFNHHYGSNVTVEFVEFDSSGEALEAVLNGDVDAAGPSFVPSVFLNNVSRTDLFQASCPDSAYIIGVALSADLHAKDWTEFRNFYITNTTITDAEKPKVATYGFGDYLIAVGLLPGFNVTVYPSQEEYIAAFNNGDADVLWDTTTSDFSAETGLGLTRPAQFALSDVVGTTASLFQYDKC
jgi:ABC-type amino acid transport substrate-binding protein